MQSTFLPILAFIFAFICVIGIVSPKSAKKHKGNVKPVQKTEKKPFDYE